MSSKFMLFKILGVVALFANTSLAAPADSLDSQFARAKQRQILASLKDQAAERYGQEVSLNLTTFVLGKDGAIRYVRGTKYACNVVGFYNGIYDTGRIPDRYNIQECVDLTQ